jgi:hypothetical protein
LPFLFSLFPFMVSNREELLLPKPGQLIVERIPKHILLGVLFVQSSACNPLLERRRRVEALLLLKWRRVKRLQRWLGYLESLLLLLFEVLWW